MEEIFSELLEEIKENNDLMRKILSTLEDIKRDVGSIELSVM